MGCKRFFGDDEEFGEGGWRRETKPGNLGSTSETHVLLRRFFFCLHRDLDRQPWYSSANPKSSTLAAEFEVDVHGKMTKNDMLDRVVSTERAELAKVLDSHSQSRWARIDRQGSINASFVPVKPNDRDKRICALTRAPPSNVAAID